MQTNPEVRTAAILAFPMAARRTALNLSNKAKFSAELAAMEGRRVDVDGWYHQAAIEDEIGKPRN